MSDAIVSVAIVSVFLAGAIATYRHMFNRQLHEQIHKNAIYSFRNGRTSRDAAKRIDFGEIRFIAFVYAIAWPYYWLQLLTRRAITRHDHERREALSRVAQMLIDERRNNAK